MKSVLIRLIRQIRVTVILGGMPPLFKVLDMIWL